MARVRSHCFAWKGFTALTLLLLAACRTDGPPSETERGATGAVGQALTITPTGFVDEQVVGSLANPTAMAFAPDGRLFVALQGGQLRVIKNGALLSTPFLTVSVNSAGERGLVGVAFDPNFATNNFVYVYYTQSASPIHNRVVRYTAAGDVASGATFNVLDLETLTGATNHNGGAMHFGADGKLYVAVGDNADSANSQLISNRLGKMLRINSDGTIPSDNPTSFPTITGTTSGVNRAIWAVGLRNPFSFGVQPGTGRMIINDVGGNLREEIDDGIAGSNYGWPNSEGGVSVNPMHRAPLYWYNLDTPDTCAIVGGTFYNPTTPQFPSAYVGKWFFADYCSNFIKYIDPASPPPSTGNPTTATAFATAAPKIVDFDVGPDGSLYYLGRGTGATTGVVGRIRFAAGQVPSISQQPGNQTKGLGQTATFTVAAGGSQPLSYQWQRNGTDISGATSSSYTTPPLALVDSGATYRVVVTNSFGSATSTNAVLTVLNNFPPSVTFTAPASGSQYSAGETIAYAVNATDPESGPLTFSWMIDFHHDTHFHPSLPETAGTSSGSFLVPQVGETATDVWYRIYATVTDSVGLVTTISQDVSPRVVTLTLATNPSGLQTTLDGSTPTPATLQSVVGMIRSLGAPSPQSLGGSSYAFASWSDGGAATHDIVTPAVNTTYTATYALQPWSGQDVGTVGVAGGFSDMGATISVSGGGADIAGAADAFYFVYRTLSGDGSITARVSSISGGDGNNVKAGVMMRDPGADGMGANDVNAFTMLKPNNTQNKFQRRLTSGATTTSTIAATATQKWLRLTRTGNTLLSEHSTDGVAWTTIGSDTVTMTSVRVGLAVTSHTVAALATAVFDNITITTPMPPSPPLAPSNLVATGGVNQATLTWTDNSSDETQFKIERKPMGSPDTSFAQVGTSGANVANFTDPSLAPGDYTYRVRATNGAGDSAYSNSDDATVTAPQPPAAPSALVASNGVGQATLVWTDNSSDETGFKIERKLAADPDTSFAQVGTSGANTPNFTDSPLAAGDYTYRVRATNAVGDSAYSNSDGATVTAPSGPAAPSNLNATISNGDAANLTWTDNSSNETGFRIEKKTGAGGTWGTLTTKAANSTSHTDGSLTANTYFYRVVATGTPDSAASNEVVVVIRNPEADAHVRGGANGDQNYGANTTILAKNNATVDNSRESFMRVTMADVAASVGSAKLRLFGNASASAKVIAISAVSDITWVEGTGTVAAPVTATGIDWNGKPTIGSQLATLTVGTTAAWFEFDVTAYVQAQKTAGATKVTFAITQVTSSTETQTSFNSRENASNKPMLVISSR